jgi:chloramphenicol O-acetyltransferase type A
MRRIDLGTWPRHEHFRFFRGFDYPHFNICADVRLTDFCTYIKEHGISFNLSIVYVLARTANALPEFRYRIRGEEVVEHEVVHPSSTIMGKADVFSFCSLEYQERFPDFAAGAVEKIEQVKEDPRLFGVDLDRDDWLFMTAIPWVSFTSFMHPLKFPVDSVPRLAWGKFFEDGDQLKMPLSVQAHHALMDGLHVGRYFELAQEYFRQPEGVLNGR